jgi:hypothetical protein
MATWQRHMGAAADGNNEEMAAKLPLSPKGGFPSCCEGGRE